MEERFQHGSEFTDRSHQERKINHNSVNVMNYSEVYHTLPKVFIEGSHYTLTK